MRAGGKSHCTRYADPGTLIPMSFGIVFLVLPRCTLKHGIRRARRPRRYWNLRRAGATHSPTKRWKPFPAAVVGRIAPRNSALTISRKRVLDTEFAENLYAPEELGGEGEILAPVQIVTREEHPVALVFGN